MSNKYIAVALAVVVVILAVLLIGSWLIFRSSSNENPTASTTIPIATSTNTSWKTYIGPSFSIQYDPTYALKEELAASTTDWQYNNQDQTLGTKLITITIPKEFEPQTNFSEGQVRIGMSKNTKAVSDCLKLSSNNGGNVFTEMVNGVLFTGVRSSDAGAGNIYDVLSYRAVYGDSCYAIDLITHSTQLANYPTELNLREFDHAKASNALKEVFSTFLFK